MKKLYNEFFYVPKHGKVRENVMMTRVVVTVVTMLLCLFAMTLTAYAYFSYNVSSGFNVIKSSNFDVSIQIIDNESEVEVNKIDNTTHTVFLEAGKTYSVTIDESKNSTANTGFCIVTAEGCPFVYHTQQLGVDESVKGGRTDIIEFELQVNVSKVVKFISHWGASSYYDEYREKGDNDIYITNGENIIMNITDTPAGNSEFEEETTINTTIPTTSQVTTTAPKMTVPTTVNATTTIEAPTTQPTTLQTETTPVETTVDSGNVE